MKSDSNLLTRVSLFLLRSAIGIIILGAAGCTPTLKQPEPATIPTETPTVAAPPTATKIVSAAPTATATLEITTISMPTETGEPDHSGLPAEHYIRTIFSAKQYFSLGCEARAAVDWAGYFDVEINEFSFQYELPLSDNPDKGFVGDVNGPWGQVPPYAYGVHARPVADLLNEYGLPASGTKSLTIEQIKAELASDQPVIAWVIGNMSSGPAAEFTDQEGDTTQVAAYEHVVILTGYNTDTIRYVTNGKFYDIPTDVFARSWAVLGNMALFYDETQLP